jgi:hypothetical protein
LLLNHAPHLNALQLRVHGIAVPQLIWRPDIK